MKNLLEVKNEKAAKEMFIVKWTLLGILNFKTRKMDKVFYNGDRNEGNFKEDEMNSLL